MATSLEQANWFYAHDRKKVGPVSWAQLRHLAAAGQLRPGDMVLADGAARWTQAAAVDGLFPPLAIPVTLASSLPAAEGTQALAPGAIPAGPFSAPTIGRGAGDGAGAPALPSIPGYTIRGELGRGGMGVVYRAEQVRLKRPVALKMILGGVIAGSVQRERFRAEGEAVARLQHPNVVQIYEVGEHDGLPFFSLEYCAGGSLDRRLDGTPQPPGEAARLVEVLARAMQAAHERNLVHRDLKPANVLFLADGTPKITDFGLVKKLDETAVLTQSGAVMGTPSYMAPEQALGNIREQGPASDIYALGAILYELLAGRPPFKAASPMETLLQVAADEPVPPSRLQPKVPADLETICLKCLEKAQARRYATALALAEDLRRFQAGEAIQARPAGRLERGWKWARRRPAQAALAAVSGLALVVMLIGGLSFNVQLRQERNAALAEKDHAEREWQRAERNEAETNRQKAKVEEQRKRAEEREADAKRELDLSRRSLLTAQVARAAGVWSHDPLQALRLLQDETTCPKELRDFAWGYYHLQCKRWLAKILDSGQGGILRVSVTRDGKLAASAGADGSVKLWDMETRKAVGHPARAQGPRHFRGVQPGRRPAGVRRP